MVILLICTLVSIALFGCFAVIKAEEFQRKMEIFEKLIQSVQERLDKHNL